MRHPWKSVSRALKCKYRKTIHEDVVAGAWRQLMLVRVRTEVDVHGYMYELDEVANEAHNGEADGDSAADLKELCGST